MPTARSLLGERGEGMARAYLKSKGYELVTNNFRCPQGEVDIIAKDGPCLVFVEVRTRRRVSWYGTPQESISKSKRQKLIATAETYLQSIPSAPEDWRIDVIAIRLDKKGSVWPVDHIENAIQLS